MCACREGQQPGDQACCTDAVFVCICWMYVKTPVLAGLWKSPADAYVHKGRLYVSSQLCVCLFVVHVTS